MRQYLADMVQAYRESKAERKAALQAAREQRKARRRAYVRGWVQPPPGDEPESTLHRGFTAPPPDVVQRWEPPDEG